MQIKNPGIFIAFILFMLLNIMDIITAFFILKGEANPLYLLTGSIWPVIILKIIILIILGFYIVRNIYPSTLIYYIICVIMIIGSVLVGLGVFSNLIGIMNPEKLEDAASISTEEKIEQYNLFLLVFYLIPSLGAILPFLLYNYTLKNAEINKEYFKKKKRKI